MSRRKGIGYHNRGMVEDALAELRRAERVIRSRLAEGPALIEDATLARVGMYVAAAQRCLLEIEPGDSSPKGTE